MFGLRNWFNRKYPESHTQVNARFPPYDTMLMLGLHHNPHQGLQSINVSVICCPISTSLTLQQYGPCLWIQAPFHLRPFRYIVLSLIPEQGLQLPPSLGLILKSLKRLSLSTWNKLWPCVYTLTGLCPAITTVIIYWIMYALRTTLCLVLML